MLVAEELDLVVLDEMEDAPPQCESGLEAHQHEHAAHWYAQCPCGDIIAVCHARRSQAYAQDGWKCSVKAGCGCTAWHPYAEIGWTPCRGSR